MHYMLPPGKVTPSPWQSIPVPLREYFFPDIQPEPALVQLEASPSCPIASYVGEEANPHLNQLS